MSAQLRKNNGTLTFGKKSVQGLHILRKGSNLTCVQGILYYEGKCYEQSWPKPPSYIPSFLGVKISLNLKKKTVIRVA